jgi:hypothetical protein
MLAMVRIAAFSSFKKMYISVFSNQNQIVLLLSSSVHIYLFWLLYAPLLLLRQKSDNDVGRCTAVHCLLVSVSSGVAIELPYHDRFLWVYYHNNIAEQSTRTNALQWRAFY